MSWLNVHDAWTGNDKIQHFEVGMCLAMLIGVPTGAAWGFQVGAAAGLLTAILAGAAKEVWDHYNPPHQPSLQDAIVTALGGLVTAGALLAGEAIAKAML